MTAPIDSPTPSRTSWDRVRVWIQALDDALDRDPRATPEDLDERLLDLESAVERLDSRTRGRT